MTNSADIVVLTYRDGRTIVISPEKQTEFVAAVNRQAGDARRPG